MLHCIILQGGERGGCIARTGACAQSGLHIARGGHKECRVMATSASVSNLFAASPRGKARPLAIARWLEIVAAMVVGIVVVGGITRLTESGLSITEWNVVTGILPPLTEAAWQAEFAKYQATPEYRLEAALGGMGLADFQFIFFWEWVHRLIARVIGLVYALPLAWFWLRGAIPQGFKLRLLGLLALGGLQGLFGWLMVQSGLVGDMTDVSHFRLSVHLLTALLLLAGLVWTARDMRLVARDPAARPAPLTGFAALVAGALFIQLLLGAWVAGLNAGHAAYDWPLMNGRFFPEVDWSRGFGWALTHDPFLLQFLHRWWAFVAVAALVWLARRVRPSDQFAAIAVNAAFGTMVLLGIATVLSGVSLWVAAAHQLVGALTVAATARAMHSDGLARRRLADA
jgi:heme a synthase